MGNYLNDYNILYTKVLKEFEKYQDITFKYDNDDIYDLPRTFSLDKYSVYNEYAIISIKEDNLIGISIEDREEKIFYFDDLTLPSLIELLEYTNDYIKQLN